MIYDILALGRDDPLEKIDSITNKNLCFHDIYCQKMQGESSQSFSAFQEEIRYSNELFEEVESIIKEFLSVVRICVYISYFICIYKFKRKEKINIKKFVVRTKSIISDSK